MQFGWVRLGGGVLFFLVGVALGTLGLVAMVQAQERGGDVTAGKLVYEQRCQRCHGLSGWGDGPQAGELRVPPRNFRGPMLSMKTDEQLLASIEFGIVLSPMHAFRGALSDQEMRDVLAYVRVLGQRGR